MTVSNKNIDLKTVEGFGEEWEAFSQNRLTPVEHKRMFDEYFSPFPFERLPANSTGFDIGCGTGRWAMLAAERFGHLHCIDPAEKALNVARRRLANLPNVSFHHASIDDMPLADGSQDFGYALGVLHHVPDPEAALAACVRKLKPGAPFLAYIYYAFDNKPSWFRAIWKGTDTPRRLISRLPIGIRKTVTNAIATLVYFPLARSAGVIEKLGFDVSNLPLSPYRYRSFYSMRTDALDRFGTRLEHRFTRAEIDAMMRRSGLSDVVFRDGVPYWVACGIKTGAG